MAAMPSQQYTADQLLPSAPIGRKTYRLSTSRIPKLARRWTLTGNNDGQLLIFVSARPHAHFARRDIFNSSLVESKLAIVAQIFHSCTLARFDPDGSWPLDLDLTVTINTVVLFFLLL